MQTERKASKNCPLCGPPPHQGEGSPAPVEHEDISMLWKPPSFWSLLVSGKYRVKASRVSLHLGLCSARVGTLPSGHSEDRYFPEHLGRWAHSVHLRSLVFPFAEHPAQLGQSQRVPPLKAQRGWEEGLGSQGTSAVKGLSLLTARARELE